MLAPEDVNYDRRLEAEQFDLADLPGLQSAASATHRVIRCWQLGMWVLPFHILAFMINPQRTYVFMITHPKSFLQFILIVHNYIGFTKPVGLALYLRVKVNTQG